MCREAWSAFFAMPEIADFATLVLLLAGGFSVAVFSTRVTERLPVPAPALFLAAAALSSDLWPTLYGHVPVLTVERIAVVALVVILFNGGIDIGMRRLRAAHAYTCIRRTRDHFYVRQGAFGELSMAMLVRSVVAPGGAWITVITAP